ncbi:hypothetical protein D9M70_522810 [compost metagenome]
MSHPPIVRDHLAALRQTRQQIGKRSYDLGGSDRRQQCNAEVQIPGMVDCLLQHLRARKKVLAEFAANVEMGRCEAGKPPGKIRIA